MCVGGGGGGVGVGRYGKQYELLKIWLFVCLSVWWSDPLVCVPRVYLCFPCVALKSFVHTLNVLCLYLCCCRH